MRLRSTPFTIGALITVLAGAAVVAQDNANTTRGGAPNLTDPQAIIAEGVEFILAAQEGPDKAEWPYEGVYRVGGQIPIGYRVGGTGISASALLIAPGYSTDLARKDAVHRAIAFIIKSIDEPLMNPDYEGGYDVRGWGYTYGLSFLLRAKSLKAVPDDLTELVEKAIAFFINAIQRTEITKVGGWNYARSQGRDAVSPPSPFMTGPTLQVLFEAKAMSYAIDENIIKRGLDCLEKARTTTGSIVYSGFAPLPINDKGTSTRDAVPGAVGRMLVSESTLFLAGRSNMANLRASLDAFITHWQWLEQRRCKNGTHEGPYGIAPYYFFYAHYYAAQAVEMLPPNERDEYRRRVRELIMSVRSPEGTWNDRVFQRSANYGTAMSVMALLAPESAKPARWQ